MITAVGRRYSICGARRPLLVPVLPAAANVGVAWISTVTLFLAVCLSVYAVVRPPEFPYAGARPPSAVARYTMSDFLNAAR